MTSLLTTRLLTLGAMALPGDLGVPREPVGLVVFVHGSGSSRSSPRNRYVAHTLHQRRFATLLFDLLTPEEAVVRRLVFDIDLLSARVGAALDSVTADAELAHLPVGLFGASTGAAAALRQQPQPLLENVPSHRKCGIG